MIDDLTQKFPLTEPQIVGEQNQKDFIVLFGALLRMRNLLSSFDDFKGNEMISNGFTGLLRPLSGLAR